MLSVKTILTQIRSLNPLIAGLLGAVLLAFLFPELGASDGPLKAAWLTKAGVIVIFFLQGLSLKTRELAQGVLDVRLHGFIHAWIFLLSPLVFLLAALVLHVSGQSGLAAGFLFIALVPTTISSAVAFASAAQGNVSAAIFNTTLSNIIGVFWVPSGCVLLFAANAGPAGDLIGPLLIKLCWLIVLPLFAGQLIGPFIGQWDWFKRLKPAFKNVNQAIILFIVFAVFSESVLNDTWATVPTGSLLLLFALNVVAVVVIHGAVWVSSGWLGFNHRDRVTALFCGSQKTLAAGAPMAVAIFTDGDQLSHLDTSLVLLPLLCYHPLQLFLAAFFLPILERGKD
ncbi:MAG: hypothetical protein RL648_614 [Verrucomicrobiota bacterium]